MNTYKVTFAKNYNPGQDTLYTYKSSEEFVPGQEVFVLQGGKVKKVKIVSKDLVYDTATESRFGTLAIAYGVAPLEAL